MSVQIPFPLPSTGFALNSKVRINLDFLVAQFNQFNTGSATWDTVAIGIANNETGTLTFYNASNANYLTFHAGATSPSTTFTLPTSAPSLSHKFLTSTTGGVMSWSTLSEKASYTGNLLVYADGSGVLQEVAVGSGNKVLVNSAPPSFFSLLGTTNQVIITPNVGDYTFSLPQSIGTGSNVVFNALQVDGGSATNPGIAVIFSGSATNTGLWSGSGTTLNMTVAGATRFSIDSTGLGVATGELRAPTLRTTTALKVSTSTGSIVTIQGLSSSFGNYTLTLPPDDGNTNDVLQTDGSGVLTWVSVSGAGGATKALDNLASVAINASLLPGSDNAIDAGSSAKNFRSVYVSTSIKNGSTTLATATELGYLTGVTSAIQTQLGTKAPLASPTFTGVVTMPTPFTLGAVSVTATGTELNYVVGVTSAIQTQLGTKASQALGNLSGVAINSSLLPASDNAISLGTSSLRWQTLYVRDISAGITGTTAGSITMASPTAAKGTLVIQAADNAGATTTNIINASQASGRTYTIPDAGASASFVMTEGSATINGTKTFAGQLIGKGTATNDSPSAGYIGEVISSAVSFTNFPTTGQFGDLTSITLTAGDWLVSVQVEQIANGAVSTTMNFGVSTTSGNAGTGLTDGNNYFGGLPTNAASGGASIGFANYRASLSGSTIHYLKFIASYTGGPPQAAGRITAVRIR